MKRNLAISIARIHRSGSAFIVKELVDLGIGAGQHPFLLALSENDGLNQEALSRFLCVDKATTARAIQRLETSKFIKRTINPSDGRTFQISLTTKGRKSVPRILKALESWEEKLLDKIAPENREALHSMLEQMAES